MASEAELRTMQEDVARMLQGGFHKDIVKLHWALFSGYISMGFTRPEALELLKEWIQVQSISNYLDDNHV